MAQLKLILSWNKIKSSDLGYKMEIVVGEAELEAMRSQVIAEMRTSIEKNKRHYQESYDRLPTIFKPKTFEDYLEKEKWQYLNNFTMRVRDVNRDDGGSERAWAKKSGNWDKTHEYNDGYSKLYRGQTRREFCETVDRAVEAAGLSWQKLGELQRDFSSRHQQEYLFPAYVRLRAIGYGHRELAD